jgi:LysM repeat protein
MSYRSPARWLAPLAILAALAAIFAIVNASTGPDDSEERPRAESSQERGDTGRRGSRRRDRETTSTDGSSNTPASGRKTYTVQAGDTLASISEDTGVPIEQLEELNPDVDSNSLSIGQEIRLAR